MAGSVKLKHDFYRFKTLSSLKYDAPFSALWGMSAGGAVMFSSLTVAERMFAGRPASVWRSRSLPILIFLQLFHSSIQLGSCRPLSLRSPNLQLPSSLVPPASCASCDNKGKFIWARGAAVLGSPIEISIVLHLFFGPPVSFPFERVFLIGDCRRLSR